MTKLTEPQRRMLDNIASYERGRPTRCAHRSDPSIRRLLCRQLVKATGRADGWTRLYVTESGRAALKEMENTDGR